MSTFDKLCDFVSETIDKKLCLDDERWQKLLILPFDYPIPLKNDWTVKLSQASSAEVEVRKLGFNNEGILFTRITLKKAEKFLGNSNEGLKKSLGELKLLSKDCENFAFKNLFFSTQNNKFYQIVTFQKFDDKSTYNFKEVLLARAHVIKSALQCFTGHFTNSVIFLIRHSRQTRKIANEIKTKIENMGFSVFITDKAFKLPQNHQKSPYKLQSELYKLVKNLVEACKDEYFCTLHNPKIDVLQWSDPTVSGSSSADQKREVFLFDYLDKEVALDSQEQSRTNRKLQVIPEGEELYWEVPLRETKQEGICPNESFTKVQGEIIHFYDEQVHPWLEEFRGTLVYSVDWEMLKPFISLPTGQRREFDWVHFSQKTMTVFEISAGNQRRPVATNDSRKHYLDGPDIRKLNQVFGSMLPFVNNLLHCVYRHIKPNASSDETLTDLTSFRKNCFKLVIYDKNFSKDEWDNFLNETPVHKFISPEALEILTHVSVANNYVIDYVCIAASDPNLRRKDMTATVQLYQMKLKADWCRAELIRSGETMHDLLSQRSRNRVSGADSKLLQTMKTIITLAARKYYSEKFKFSPQQQKLIDDEENPLKYIIGEAGSGKTHVCMAIAKKYLDKMKYQKIFYVIPKHKEQFRKFIEVKMKTQFQIDVESDERLCFIDLSREALTEARNEPKRAGQKMGLIIDECSITEDHQIKATDGQDIADLFPYFDLVCLTLTVCGQMECVPGHYNNNRPLGFQRYVLTVGYRSSSTILHFCSKMLHTATCKHICGTSIASISPRSPIEGTINLIVAKSTEKRSSFIERWRERYPVDKRCIIVFREPSEESNNCDITEVKDEVIFFHTPKDDFANLTFSGYEQDHVLILLEASICSSLLGRLITNGHAEELDLSPDAKRFGQILLNAATRAKKTLRFIILDNFARIKLKKVVVDKMLIVAPEYSNRMTDTRIEREIEKDCGTVLRVALHREDYELLKEAFRWKIFDEDDESYELTPLEKFTEYVLPGCAGREKSKKFLENLTDLLKQYGIERDLNVATREGFGKLKEWYQSVYSRGLVHVIDWRMKHGVPQGSRKNLKSLYYAILLEAVVNGSERVVIHAFTTAYQFILGGRPDLHLDELRELTDLKHKLGYNDEPESLLSLVAKTNKSPNVMRFLIRQLKINDDFNPESKKNCQICETINEMVN
ncbi:uncharacterized protein LOC142335873 isoform X2 [Convolutriloba macropyga]|uniref:uncharacterized protein LOC142335873 isoform X2 n=1 Tax=Convolutriloba macropyga TaxID=536237 RepID=UPI003F51DA41